MTCMNVTKALSIKRRAIHLISLRPTGGGNLNDLLEAKLTIARIKVNLLDLAGELVADALSDKEYAIKRILKVVEYIDESDVKVSDIDLSRH
jgi:uncharacterized Fe-S cluster-containing radical SAM superfamily enzyme